MSTIASSRFIVVLPCPEWNGTRVPLGVVRSEISTVPRGLPRFHYGNPQCFGLPRTGT